MRTCTAIVVSVLFPALVHADVPLRAQRVATGLNLPLFVTSAPGDPDRIYILEQRNTGGSATSGGIRILDLNTGSLNGSTFLTIPGVTTGDEQGVLGLAFHPNYAANGLFYVNVTAAGGGQSGQTQIREYSRVNANTASTTFSTVLAINQPQNNHNGGWLGFGPSDGFLYISSGDGGNFNDQGTGHTATTGNAQDTSNLLGKILRIDVNGTAVNGQYSIPAGNPFQGASEGADEIWNYGLRNPWRASFDRGSVGGGTGDFYIGDVGQNAFEEVNYQPANSPGGENYGWRAREGAHDTGLYTLPGSSVDPIHEYPNPADGRAVTGGYVYRGTENDALVGTYIFGDYLSARIWSFKYDGTTKTNFRELTDDIDFAEGQGLGLITSFGEDAQGRIYVTDRDGDVFRLVPAFPGDANLDDFVDAHDLGAMALNWQQQTGATWAEGDFTDDGKVDVLDLIVLANHWLAGPDALAAALVENGLPADVVPEPGGMIGVMSLFILSMRRRFGWRRIA